MPRHSVDSLIRYGASEIRPHVYVAVCSDCGVLAVDARDKGPILTAARAHARRWNVATRLALVPKNFGLAA